MNFSVYLNKRMGEKITKMARSLRRSRNSIICEALEEWLISHSRAKWPKHFFDFPPIEDVPDFKALRKDLKDNLSEDPLA